MLSLNKHCSATDIYKLFEEQGYTMEIIQQKHNPSLLYLDFHKILLRSHNKGV
jgi:hypothetical protein